MENLELFSNLYCSFGRTHLNHWCPVVEFLKNTIRFHHKSRKAMCSHYFSWKFVLRPGGFIPCYGFTLPVLSPSCWWWSVQATAWGLVTSWGKPQHPTWQRSFHPITCSPSLSGSRERIRRTRTINEGWDNHSLISETKPHTQANFFLK